MARVMPRHDTPSTWPPGIVLIPGQDNLWHFCVDASTTRTPMCSRTTIGVVRHLKRGHPAVTDCEHCLRLFEAYTDSKSILEGYEYVVALFL